MHEENGLHLTGGIFFSLLLEIANIRSGNRSKHTQVDVFVDLIHIVRPGRNENKNNTRTKDKTLIKNITKYKQCSGPEHLHTIFFLEKEDEINEFDSRVKKEYANVLDMSNTFVKKYFSENECYRTLDRIVKILLGLINCDLSISNDSTFYIQSNGVPLTKAQIRNIDEIYFPAFILGIWHYIISNRVQNSKGQYTHRCTFQKSDNRRSATFNPQTDIEIKKDIKITLTIPESSKTPGNCETDNHIGTDDALGKISARASQGESSIPKPLDNKASDDMHQIDEEQLQEKCSDIPLSFDEYLKHISDTYSIAKTPLYTNAPKNFYDIYVESRLCSRPDAISNVAKEIFPANLKELVKRSRFIILIGECGCGKSMILQHLLLSSAQSYVNGKWNRVPVLVELKNYTENKGDLLQYLRQQMQGFSPNITTETFENYMSDGKFLLLFDGIDEIETKNWGNFQRQLSKLAHLYEKNMFILSSRPMPSDNFIEFREFILLDIEPFSNSQRKELIGKISRLSNLNEKKEASMILRVNDPFGKFGLLFDNPMYLTNSMVYLCQEGLPRENHELCWKIYETLFNRCSADASDTKRRMRTNLDLKSFALVFSGICTAACYEGLSEFTSDNILNYLRFVSVRRNVPITFSVSNFIHDATTSLCLMKESGGLYSFSNKTLQQYFYAWHYYRFEPENSWLQVEEDFECLPDLYDKDLTLEFLYEMNADRTEQYIFFPFLHRMFGAIEKEEGYWTFLETFHPRINYYCTELAGSFTNDSPCLLYDFIVQKKFLKKWIMTGQLPECPSFVIGECDDVCMEDKDFLKNRIFNILNKDSLDTLLAHKIIGIFYNDDSLMKDTIARKTNSGDDVSSLFRPIPGKHMQFRIEDVRKRNDYECRQLIEALDREDFPLKIEYKRVREYLQSLREKYPELNKHLQMPQHPASLSEA